MGVLVGGESKVGSTEDEGISGGPGLDMIEVMQHSHMYLFVNHDANEPRHHT